MAVNPVWESAPPRTPSALMGWEPLSEENGKGVFSFVNEVIWGTNPKIGVWLPAEPSSWLEGWNFQPQLPDLWGRREAGG